MARPQSPQISLVMSSVPGIVCFEHCGQRVFCLDVPQICPGGCGTALKDCDFLLSPFQLPSPFSKAVEYPCSIAIKPTEGTFLRDYRSGHNLHIGLTDSQGKVHEFAEYGLHSDSNDNWHQCIVINLLAKEFHPVISDDPDWKEYWDWTLAQVLASGQWNTNTYHRDEMNCFDFVLTFLRSLRQEPFSSLARDKVDFCQRVILPKTSLAGKYIRLFRKLEETTDGTIWRGQTNNKLTKILGRAFSMSTERHRKLKWDEFGGNPELDVLITTNPDFKINLSQTIGDAQRTLFRAQLDNTNLDGQGICGKSLKSVLLERLEDITKAFPSKTFSKLIPQTSPRCLEAFERTLPGLSSRQLSELTMSSDDVFISYFVDHKVDPTHSKLQEVTLAIFEITHFGKIRRYHDQRGQIDKELDNDLYQGAQLEQTRDKYIRGLDRLRETSNRIPDWEKEGVFRARNAKFRFSSDIQDWVLTDFVFIPFSQLSAMDKIKWKSIVSEW
eukprot:TCALIF_04590-PA protein Name:"Similar to C3orf83 Putative uncharacterized protein C3orf83 (Homo sapiens)" AED:0.13 eAED:0.13 QI:0/0.25/0/0.8/1/1/5/0/497